MTSLGDNRCPLCRAALWAPYTATIGSKTCPRCGAELWVLVMPDGLVFCIRQPGQSKSAFLAGLAGPLYGVTADEMEEIVRGADSLDVVELVMDIEDKLKSNRC